MLPFTHAQFLEVFAAYNVAVWPSQVVAYVVAAVMLDGLVRGGARWGAAAVSVGLALMWLWTGIAYHWLHFTAINKVAWAFGALFVLQGILFALAAARDKLILEASVPRLPRWLGWGLVVYAMAFYPLLGATLGPGYPELPMFGITPCPVTLFTFGLLLLAGGRMPWWLLVIPVGWSLVGGSAAFLLQVPQDWPLLASGASVFLLARRGGSAALRPRAQA